MFLRHNKHCLIWCLFIHSINYIFIHPSTHSFIQFGNQFSSFSIKILSKKSTNSILINLQCSNNTFNHKNYAFRFISFLCFLLPIWLLSYIALVITFPLLSLYCPPTLFSINFFRHFLIHINTSDGCGWLFISVIRDSCQNFKQVFVCHQYGLFLLFSPTFL